MNIAITGSNGFIGKNLVTFLSGVKDLNLILINRNSDKNFSHEYSFEDLFNHNIDIDIDIFIHLASPNFDNEKNEELKNGIYNLTKKILDILKDYNCEKFIFFSTAKVYGEASIKSISYDENSLPSPKTDYAKIKLETENLILKRSENSRHSFIIYRLPFVYGSGMNSNLSKIFKIIEKSFPILILDRSIDMKKSFLSVNNINEIIRMNIENKNLFSNMIINISDTDSVSLSDILRSYKFKLNSKSIFIKINRTTFKLFQYIPFFNKLMIKIYGSFEIDNSKMKTLSSCKLLSSSEGLDEYLKNKI